MEDVKWMWYTMNEGYRAWGELKSVLSNRGLGIKAKKCLYEGVIVPTTLHGVVRERDMVLSLLVSAFIHSIPESISAPLSAAIVFVIRHGTAYLTLMTNEYVRYSLDKYRG